MKDPDLYFMRQAFVASTEATCPRKHVGAVIVLDNRTVSTGYNGSLPGQPHCEDVGCLMEDGHCVRTIHSEANAILQAATRGSAVTGGTIYVTASPCFACFKLIVGARLKRIVFGELYRDPRITRFAQECGIALTDLSLPAFCGKCAVCEQVRRGCACRVRDLTSNEESLLDGGCFVCNPQKERPSCPVDWLAEARSARNWRASF